MSGAATRLPLAVLLACAGPASAAAQLPAPHFVSRVDAVTLDVVVTTRDGRPVGGLTASDFSVLDEGTPRDVTFFAAGHECPLAVSLLIDRSYSLRGGALDSAKGAATALLNGLGPGDLAEVATFNHQVDILQRFGERRDDIAGQLARLTATGETELFRTMLAASHRLDALSSTSVPPCRRAMIVVTDGVDSTNHMSLDDVLSIVRRSGTLVYVVHVKGRTLPRAVAVLPSAAFLRLPLESGGLRLGPGQVRHMGRAFERIRDELRASYRLGFLTTANDGAWRRLVVRVNREDAQTRTRTGYYAPFR